MALLGMTLLNWLLDESKHRQDKLTGEESCKLGYSDTILHPYHSGFFRPDITYLTMASGLEKLLLAVPINNTEPEQK